MIVKTLDDLRAVDDRVLRFTEMGLSLGRQMRPEDAAEYQQQLVAQFDLAPEVAQGTRNSFDDLRSVFVRGVFCYEIFTLVNDRALFVLEQALRDRFVEKSHGSVTFVEPSGVRHMVTVDSYAQVFTAIRKHRRSQLLLDDGHTIDFNGMLDGLRSWARHAGMLRGQRNLRIEDAIAKLRNLVAYPGGYHLITPVDAARTLGNLAEIINQLWGAATPGGRLYPAPLRREVVALAWDATGEHTYVTLAEGLADAVDSADRTWLCVVLRAVFRADQRIADPNLHEFDSRHEVTHYPADLLWGPGTITEAAAWHAEHRPQPDECEYLDRTFLIRHDGVELYLPMRPDVAAALTGADQSGSWYAVKADHPNDAFHHVRNLVSGVGCAHRGPCPMCHAETVRDRGSFEHVVIANNQIAAPDTVAASAFLPTDVASPFAQPRTLTITMGSLDREGPRGPPSKPH